MDNSENTVVTKTEAGRSRLDPVQMAIAASEASDLLRLLSNANRLMILCFLLEGERSVGEMEEKLRIRQPTLSQQIAVLREARLIQQSRRQAKVVFYRLRDRKVIPVIEALYGVFCSGELVKGDADADPLAGATTDEMLNDADADQRHLANDADNWADADCGVMAVTHRES